jgi:hypothetical protein
MRRAAARSWWCAGRTTSASQVNYCGCSSRRLPLPAQPTRTNMQQHALMTHQSYAGTRDDPLPAAGSFSLRLAKAVRCCPLLVVKSNNTGHFLQGGSAAAGLRVLVDCQSNTRHLLGWLMGRLDPDKDGLFLAVTRAVDQGTGLVGVFCPSVCPRVVGLRCKVCC